MKKKRSFLLVLLLLVLAVGGYFGWTYFSEKKTYLPYSKFYELAGAGQIDSVVIKEGGIDFTSQGKDFKTDNPDSPLLHEYLLQNGVSVKVEKDGAEIFNLNMANYLWSFSQMSRLSQAVTVYSRELSTRY